MLRMQRGIRSRSQPYACAGAASAGEAPYGCAVGQRDGASAADQRAWAALAARAKPMAATQEQVAIQSQKSRTKTTEQAIRMAVAKLVLTRRPALASRMMARN